MKKLRLLLATVAIVVGVTPFIAGPAHADPIPCGQKIVIGHAYVGQVPCILRGP